MAAEKKPTEVVIMIAASTVQAPGGLTLPGQEVELSREEADRLLAAGVVRAKA